jgi:inositol polyphosphate 5-phosphatase INPP5B/F
MAASSAAPTSPVSETSDPVEIASAPNSLARAVYARRAEYVRPHRIRVKIGTWNVAGCLGTDKDLASWFVAGKGVDQTLASIDVAHNSAIEDNGISDGLEDGQPGTGIRLVGGDKIGLYVLGLQEIVDLNVAREYMNRVYVDPEPMEKWKAALEAAMPPGYELVTSEQLSGLLLLVYASPEVASTISNVSTVSVGTGLLGYLGNKGAVTTRILLGETTRMVFVNCHLASGAEQTYLDRRIWDVGQILSRTQFDPVTHISGSDGASEKIGDEDFAFWFGDLNFRLDGLPGDDIRRLLTLHTRGEYDLSRKPLKTALDDEGVIVMRSVDSDDDEATTIASSNPSPNLSFDESLSSLPDPDDFLPDAHDDPASLQATLDSLLPHDQLRRVIKEKKVFHDGWREGSITFLPSYKYDVGTVALFDSSEKRRAPSWCDRILYRTRKDRNEYETRVKEEEEARKKDEEMKARGIDQAADDDDVLFSYDPENDGDDQPAGNAGFDYDEYDEGDDGGLEEVVTKEGFIDHIALDIYASHQRIISSDHKPIISVFTLDYDAVVPELKAKVHAEVARELDRAENEGRPVVTIVLDRRDSSASASTADANIEAGDTIEIGDVMYLKKQVSSLTIANTGGVQATFSFVDNPMADDPDSPSSPKWLRTSFKGTDTPDQGTGPVDLGNEVTLEPGETVSAILEVMVDEISHVRALNDGRDKLEDILVLRVLEGRDHFIPIKGNWLPTCFGRSIEELIRVPDGGIREFVESRLCFGIGSIPYDLDVRCSAPKELFKLTEAVDVLLERVLADELMLEDCHVPRDLPGWPFDEGKWTCNELSSRLSQKLALIEALDTDKPILSALLVELSSIMKLEIVCEVLLLFLRALKDGIVGVTLWAKIEIALPHLGIGGERPTQDIENDKTVILDILSTAPNHNIAFVFLTTMLAKVVVELNPLSKSDLEALITARKPGGTLGRRRSLGFRRSVGSAEAEAALAKLRARERRVAEIFGNAVCNAPVPAKDKERKATDDKQRAVLEMFIRRSIDEP